MLFHCNHIDQLSEKRNIERDEIINKRFSINMRNHLLFLEIIHIYFVYPQHRNHDIRLYPYPLTDVALSSGLLCHDPNSPTQGCCSDGAVLLGGFGGPLNPNLTVSSVEYLGPEEELPPPGKDEPSLYSESADQ